MAKSWKDIAEEIKSGKYMPELPVSVNDLLDRLYDGVELSLEQRKAIQNYEKYRVRFLNSATNDLEFRERYEELQIKANVSPFQEFLEEGYDQ